MNPFTENTPADQPSGPKGPDSCELSNSLLKPPGASVSAPAPDETVRLTPRSADFPTAAERRLIESCPQSGDGVHPWTFKVLMILTKHWSDDKKLFLAARKIFDEFASRHVDDGEILRQIGNARRCMAWGGSDLRAKLGRRSSPAWPLPDLAAIESIVRSGPRLTQLQSALPACPVHCHLGGLEILQRLFPGDPLLCCGKQLWSARTMPLSKWDRLDECQYIVPSPMTKIHGTTCGGKESMRCLDNTGARHYLVVEFDFKPYDADAPAGGVPTDPRRDANEDSKKRMVSRLLRDGFEVTDMCAALIHRLASHITPAMVVYSGGKSLHAWFPCMGVEDHTLEPFMHYAVQMGADPATWSRCQFVRVPGGLRNNGKRQTVHYFNPEVLP